MHNENRTEAITGLEIIIVIVILCIFIWLCGSIIFKAVMPDFGDNSGTPGGLIGFATGESDEILMTDGASYGAQNTGGVLFGVELEPKENSGTDMGSCTIPLKLFIGKQVSVDMNTAKILFSYNGITEELSYSDKRPLQEPSWTIAQKSSMIPLSNADSDNILEPNEIFTILIYPEANVPAREKFSVIVTPKSYDQLELNPVVPAEIAGQRIVELIV